MKNPTLVGIAALVLIGSALGEDVKITAAAPWQRVEGGGEASYRLDYPGQGYSALSLVPQLRPDTHYRVSWKMKSSVPDGEGRFSLAIGLNGRHGATGYALTPGWSDYVGYFYSGATGAAELKMYLESSAAKTVEVKDVQVVPVTPEMLAKNLLPDGGFEAADTLPANWSKTGPANPAVISGPQGFLSGEKCMEVDFKEGQRGIKTIRMPVTPGKEVRFTFWAKAEKECQVEAAIQAWSAFGHQGDHFYKIGRFKITPDWKEYAVQAQVPSDAAQYPDLQDRALFVSIEGSKTEDGKVWVDDVSFGETAP